MHLTNSWIIADRSTSLPVLETWSAEVVAKINRDKYDVHTAHAWLVELNRKLAIARVVSP